MQTGGLGGQSHGQHAGAGAQSAGQRQLPHKGAVPVPEGKLSPGGQQAHQNGQVVQGADLLHMGGGQIDGDAAHRKGEAAIFDGGAHPLPGFVDRGVGQAHHREGGQPIGQVALHRHRIPSDAVEPEGVDQIDHLDRPPIKRNRQFERLVKLSENSKKRMWRQEETGKFPLIFLGNGRKSPFYCKLSQEILQ